MTLMAVEHVPTKPGRCRNYFREGSKFLAALFLLILFPWSVRALHNHVGAHDPSSIIKSGDTYWIFTTGDGIYSMYSKDLVKWTAGKTPFPAGSFPSWINNFVPGFGGNFWAPECFYMNGKYYLYYSCSAFGSINSAIGLLTGKSLDPASADYGWTDEGMVIYSTTGYPANCIDPALFRDEEGKIWISYGSWFGGIMITEIDSVSGKPKSSTIHAVASGDCEASYVIPHGSYYYLFINRGTCCQGTSSTYYIQVGRSMNQTGPYLDKNGVNLNSQGGSTILQSNGSFIGPGCLGYFVENSTEFATYHYYDGDKAGMATLAVANMQWDDQGWPVITNNWLEDGSFSVVNRNSLQAWKVQGCGGAEGDRIIQSSYEHLECQKWFFQAAGNGFYKISPASGGLLVQPEGCQSLFGRNLSLGQYTGLSCQLWRVERTASRNYVLSTKINNLVAEVPGGSTIEGDLVKVGGYLEEDYQRWFISDTAISVSVRDHLSAREPRIIIFPNPVSGNEFRFRTENLPASRNIEVQIFTMAGRLVFRETYPFRPEIQVGTDLSPDIYIIRIKSPPTWITEKLVIQ